MEPERLARHLIDHHYPRWQGDLPAFLAAVQGYQAVGRGLIEGEAGPPGIDWAGASPRLAGDLYALLRPDRERSPAIFTPEALARELAGRLMGESGRGAAPLPNTRITRQPRPAPGREGVSRAPRGGRTRHGASLQRVGVDREFVEAANDERATHGSPLQSGIRGLPRIIDPAAGAGALLLAAAEQIERMTGAARREIVGQLYGVDADPLAIQVARDALWLWAADPGLARESMAARLICADTLRDDAALESLGGPFGLLISNPPWASVFTRARGADDSDLRARYQSIRGAYDLFVPFVERSVQLLQPGGRAGFILPNRVLSAGYAEGLRRWLGREAQIELIEAHPARGGFAAGVYPVTVILRREPAADGHRVAIEVKGWRGEVEQAEVTQMPGAAWSVPFTEGWERLRPALHSRLTLGDVAELYAGLSVDEAYTLRDRIQESPLSTPPLEWLRFISSGLIRPYADIWGQKRARILGRSLLRPMIPQMALPARRQAQAQTPRLFVAGLSLGPVAAFDPGLSQPGVSTTVIASSAWPLMALCALLNATTAAKLYRALYGGLALSGGYLRVGRLELARLPLPEIEADDPRLLKLELLGQRVRQQAEPLLLADIERMVYHLYTDPKGAPPP